MNKAGTPTCALLAAAWLLAAAAAAAPPETRIADVSPGPMRLPASSAKPIRFHFISHPKPGETVTATFQRNGSKLDACTIQLIPDGKVTALAQTACTVSKDASIGTAPGGGIDATVPIAFTKPGRYRLSVQSGSSAWTRIGDYEMDAQSTSSLAIQLIGVTPTQAVLSYTPPDSNGCQVQVTSTQNANGWDYSTLAPDTDPNIFAGADNANLNDPVNAPQNRGFSQPDGSLAIVIGKRAAEYSQYTYRMHSRALQAATRHEAWITCGSATGTIDFSTANIMPGISYQDLLPADPDRPGDYAYPTMSWTDRSQGVVDPQTGLLLRPVSVLDDAELNLNFSNWSGAFQAPIPVYPSRNLPANSVFLPASVWKAVPNWYRFEDNLALPAWFFWDTALTSFAPNSLSITCPGCSNTTVTICLTADGVTCAFDKNVVADPNVSPDPNTNQKGILGITVNCTRTCIFPMTDPRWSDTTPVLAAWHPMYQPGFPNTVLPNFQFDSVKQRVTSVSCDGSTLVKSAGAGASMNVIWSLGTPLVIGNRTFTVNRVVDENTVLLNDPCPSGAATLTADTFGLLISAPTIISNVSAGDWNAKFQEGLTDWDSAGALETYGNCSHTPVMVGGKKGWHCLLGWALYWVAADASAALPLGTAGFGGAPASLNGSASTCHQAYWDDLDPNTLYCAYLVNAYAGLAIAQMTFHGDHGGLNPAKFTVPDALDPKHTYLPLCQTTSPPNPNNCWKIIGLNTTGTNTLFTIEGAVQAAAPDAWNNSAFAAAWQDGYNVSSVLTSKLDANHLMATTWLGQNSIGISSVLELSTPRGSVKLKSVLPSWAPPPNAPAGEHGLRWSGIHDSGGDSWGSTKVGVFPSYFRSGDGYSAGQGGYASNILSSNPVNCPSGVPGSCVSVTLDGQPGVPTPNKYEPINDAKTGKPGWGYLTDIAVGDVVCAPYNNDFDRWCPSYLGYTYFEHLRVLSVATASDGKLNLTLQRNYGGSGGGQTMDLSPPQRFYMMPNTCSYTDDYACLSNKAAIWDWASNTVDQVVMGSGAHQFTTYDPTNQQILAVTDDVPDETVAPCYNSQGAINCYSFFFGKIDPTKTISSQLGAMSTGALALNPPFGVGTGTLGVSGIGAGNDSDSHPGAHQMAMATNREKTWFVDGRPFGGYSGIITPPTPVATNVYRFPASGTDVSSQLQRYKLLPTIAACGMNVLREVTSISTKTPYAYCVTVSPGDCMPGSNPGDAYLSCPMVQPSAKPSACANPGIATYAPEVRDTCLTLSGPNTVGYTQTGFATQNNGIWSPLPPDARLRSTRLLTRGLSRYRVHDPYLNPKTTPDGGVLLMRTMFMAGYSTQFLMAKMPPFPDPAQDPLDRRGFVPTPVTIDPAPPGTTSVKVQFGYNPNFNCMSRPEPCEARADFDPSGLSSPFYFASESAPDGMACDSSGNCPSGISLPGISQRVVFYQAVYLVNGSPVPGTPRVTVVPDPVPVVGNN